MNRHAYRLCTLQVETIAEVHRPTHPAGSCLSYQELRDEVLRQLG